MTFLNNTQAFPSGGKKKKLRRILREPVGGIPRHVYRFFRAKYRRYDLPVFNMK